MNDRQISDLIWGFIYGVIIGWILLGTFKLLWWILKVLWRLVVWLADRIRGRNHQRRVITFERAEALESDGHLLEAAAMYRELANSRSNEIRAQAFYSLGSVLELQGAWDEALAAYAEAIRQREPEVTPLALLGYADVLYLGRHDRAAAATAYRDLLTPGHLSLAEHEDRESLVGIASKNLASLLYDDGEFCEAEQLCRKAMEIDASSGGHDVGLVMGLARVIASQGRVTEALALLRGTAPTKHARVASRKGCPLFRGDSLDDVASEIGAYQSAG